MRDGEPQIYTALATMRNGYMQSQWSRVQMFLAFNTIAFPFVFSSQQSEDVKFFLSLAGIFVHLILLQGTLRADMWISKIDAKMQSIEELDAGEDVGTRVVFFTDQEFTRMRGSIFASRRIFWSVGIVVLVTWVLQTISHSYGIILPAKEELSWLRYSKE